MELGRTYERAELHDEWESLYRDNPLQDRFNDAMMDRIMRLINVPVGSQFLDAGCGVGDHAVRIARRGHRVLGVDISETILARARKTVQALGLKDRVTFACQSLEKLELPAPVDVVHCRGVLMHIPDWTRALASLCNVLQPGGRMIIFEANHRSLETMIALLVRQVSHRPSRLVRTAGGLEFWSEAHGEPFVLRTANVQELEAVLVAHGLRRTHRLASEFWDIGRFPAGFIRNSVIRFNRAWFALRLPSLPSVGNVILAVKGPA
jgi:SAM-dependent methyltransferase